MSQDERKRRLDLEARAVAAERKVGNHHGNRSSLDAAISAAELYMQALRLAENPADKKRLDAKTRELLSRAEQLKSKIEGGTASPDSRRQPASRCRVDHPLSKRKLTTRETIILLEGSKLNGALFKPWDAPPPDEAFVLKEGEKLWADNFEFSLSETQLKHFAGWKRPQEALSLVLIQKNGRLLPNEATMTRPGPGDMVQDVAPDCSLVASLCVATARAEKGHRKVISTILHPYNHAANHPALSQNGRYILRLYFNGCWRRVEIDDRLPTSKSSRVLHVIDRSHPGLLWPVIVEKAYLKVRGGYDFPGSNSGTDIAVLTGWIPQQVFLHDEDVEPQSLWEELFASFVRGEVMCTLGTGKLGQREQKSLGLGAEHDYAVLDMKESGESRELLIKNPWADGDVWKGATKCRPNPGHENDSPQAPVDGQTIDEMKPGTFWMDFNSVFQYFEHMYVNWNPGLFAFREDIHFSWHLPDVVQAGNLFVDHPQFAVRAAKAGDVWILLNRHFRTGDYSVQNHGKNGYISLYLFDNHGGRVFSSEDATVRGPFVDSPNTLLRLQARACETVTVVLGSQDLPVGKHNFTISAFSNCPVEISDAYSTYKAPTTLSAAWTRSTAGGSSDSPLYLQNPQFSLKICSEGRAAIVLKALSADSASKPNNDVHVKVLVASSNGCRITKMRQRDTMKHSGDYRRGTAVVETTLPKGTYTVICSTFERDQLSRFHISFYTTIDASECQFSALPAENSGRFSIMAEPAVFANATTKLIAPVTITRMTKAIWKASLTSGSGSGMFRMLLEQGQGPYKRTVATSTSENQEYEPIATGLRIDDTDLNSALASRKQGGLWLVIEKPPYASTESTQTTVLQVEALSEERIEIGNWTAVED